MEKREREGERETQREDESASLTQQGLIQSLNRKFQPVEAGEALEQPRRTDKEPLTCLHAACVSLFVCVFRGRGRARGGLLTANHSSVRVSSNTVSPC